jgi:hypothetical protein
MRLDTVVFVLCLIGAFSISGLAFYAKAYYDGVLLLLIGLEGIALVVIGFTKRNITGFLALIGIYLLIEVAIFFSEPARNFLMKGHALNIRDIFTIASSILCVLLIVMTVYLHRVTVSPSVIRNEVIVRRDTLAGRATAPDSARQPLIEDQNEDLL